MSTELVTMPAQAGELDVMTLGKILVESRYFADAAQAAQAVVKVLAGREMGFGPIASMTGIHIVQGRPTLGADLLAKAVKRSGRYNYRVTELTDDRCSIAFFERDGEGWQQIGVSPFTLADAKRAGTKNLDKYPRNMLFARAMSNGVKWFCPDAIGLTVYDPSELPQDDAPQVVNVTTGEIVDVAPTIIAPTPEPPPANGNGPTQQQVKMFHAIGRRIYGKEWTEIGRTMVADICGSQHTTDLTRAQMSDLIDKLRVSEASIPHDQMLDSISNLTPAQPTRYQQDVNDLFGPQ